MDKLTKILLEYKHNTDDEAISLNKAYVAIFDLLITEERIDEIIRKYPPSSEEFFYLGEIIHTALLDKITGNNYNNEENI